MCQIRRNAMASINPYLNFNGNTEEAFQFYKSVFGGEFSALMRFKDTPEADKVAPGDRDKIMHVALPLGNGNVLMASDAPDSMGQKHKVGNNFYLYVEAGSKEEADMLFSRLSPAGKVEMPMQKTFWGAYFGMLADKFGVQWMVNYTEKSA
jgi:PhnB protein